MVSVLARDDLGKATATTPVNAHAQDSLSGFDGQAEPKLARIEGTGCPDRARGGTVVVGDLRMMTLLVDLSGDGPGTIRPTGEVPKSRL